NYLSISNQVLTAELINLDTHTTGVLPISKGGTNLTTVGTSGQLLRSNGTELEYWTPDYLTSETDPTVPAHVKGITSGDITNWNTAYGWGDFRQYGLAVPYSLPSGSDLSTIDFTGFVRTSAGTTTDYPPGISGNGFVISNYISNVRGQQLAMAVSSDRLFFRRNFDGWQPWVEIATLDKTVNMTGNQTGIAGNKQWTGRQQWSFPSNVGLVSEARSVQVVANSNGPYVVGFDNNGDQIFTLRTYATSGIQLALNAGGISTPNHGTSADWN